MSCERAVILNGKGRWGAAYSFSEQLISGCKFNNSKLTGAKNAFIKNSIAKLQGTHNEIDHNKPQFEIGPKSPEKP